MLSHVDFTEEQLKMLQQNFSGMQDYNALHDSLVIDRCSTIEFWRLSPDEQKKYSFNPPSLPSQILYSASGLKRSDSLISLDMMESQLAALTLPLHERVAELEKIKEEANSNIFMPMRLYLQNSLPHFKVAQLDLRCIGTLKCAEVGIAVERYRKVHGALPETLDALVPEFIDAVPLDPFDGKPLRYKTLDDGFTVYHIGDDCIDNDGLSRKEARVNNGGKAPEQCDWPFTVRYKK